MVQKTVLKFLTLISLSLIVLTGCKKSDKNAVNLWYNKPAKTWEEALPIGNGRLGAMIYGNPHTEHIQFNEETLWDGAPRKYQRDSAWMYLPAIRQLLTEGKQKVAEDLAQKHFMGRLAYENEFPTEKKAWVDSIMNLDKVKTALRSDFDDENWPVMFIDYKSVWERKGLPDMNGSVLFRKTIDIPTKWSGKNLYLNMGKIKDQDFTYFNGIKIGSMDVSNVNRCYVIPGRLVKKGKNVIAVVINNYVSTGGFNAVRTGSKKMNISDHKTKEGSLFIEGDWKYEVIDTKPPFYPQYQSDYQPFADILIQFSNHDSITDYKRSLELNKAIASTSYNADGVNYKMEYLVSHPDNIIAVQLKSDKKNSLSFCAKLSTLHELHHFFKVNANTLGLSLKVENGKMKGVAYINITLNDGSINVSDTCIVVKDATEATLKLVAATNFKSFKDITGTPKLRCDSMLALVNEKSYAQIKKEHIQDYQPIFNRFSIDLGEHEKRNIPTDQRILNFNKEEDLDLIATYVQYARYLMLSSGRPGTNPPNLQGIWNDEMFPAWGSKYTTNINCEMNFWPVEPLNISECHNTLFKLIKEVAEEGAITARDYYHARGWVLHHNTDQWRGTAPINNSNHGIWVTGGAWLCQHLWEHYLYTQDRTFLQQEAYPLMKGAAEFFVDFLSVAPKTGLLISTPSNSPEHGGLVAGPAMDHQIIRSLFKNVIEASSLLNIDKAFADTLKEKLVKIAPDHIGKHGQLQEWQEDKDDINDHHRHVSHLWGVYPGNEITWDNKDLMNAAKQSLLYRGDDGTGWSLAWKINLWARFLDGDHANKMIKMMLSSAIDPNRESNGGSYPNLFDAHPPFQIDGNFGGASGITEMLVQSQNKYIELLPALPDVWKDGSVKGLKCRKGFELSMNWQNGKLKNASILSTAGKILNVTYKDKKISIPTIQGQSYSLDSLISDKK